MVLPQSLCAWQRCWVLAVPALPGAPASGTGAVLGRKGAQVDRIRIAICKAEGCILSAVEVCPSFLTEHEYF